MGPPSQIIGFGSVLSHVSILWESATDCDFCCNRGVEIHVSIEKGLTTHREEPHMSIPTVCMTVPLSVIF